MTHWDTKAILSSEHKLIREEPLSIRIEGKPYSVVMRTPGMELAHVAGFCLAEGIVDTIDDIGTIACCDDTNPNVITVTLEKSRKKKISQLLDRRSFISQTSCGICGKEIIDELFQHILPLSDNIQIDPKKAIKLSINLSRLQPLRDKTYASHAAALYSKEYELLSVAEDVGRHNALDKAIGELFLKGQLHQASLLILSSRISYELVQKAARAQIPIIFAISRPTSVAVELASKLNITIACLAQQSGIFIFCGKHRFM
ncbi:MAG: formate dehydrogenase accessory sulfurtransferase FdhD [Desulfobacterales bacterium]|nr:MAG: formate dehydrogenase accessory sulfurtransferase FdhD [Desulfobacterales bacterium]UCD91412.1 MAG: formate dehydrogenase accessory sulfurtransferase FdhD [Desulfobacterales bacterium]